MSKINYYKIIYILSEIIIFGAILNRLFKGSDLLIYLSAVTYFYLLFGVLFFKKIDDKFIYALSIVPLALILILPARNFERVFVILCITILLSVRILKFYKGNTLINYNQYTVFLADVGIIWVLAIILGSPAVLYFAIFLRFILLIDTMSSHDIFGKISWVQRFFLSFSIIFTIGYIFAGKLFMLLKPYLYRLTYRFFLFLGPVVRLFNNIFKYLINIVNARLANRTIPNALKNFTKSAAEQNTAFSYTIKVAVEAVVIAAAFYIVIRILIKLIDLSKNFLAKLFKLINRKYNDAVIVKNSDTYIEERRYMKENRPVRGNLPGYRNLFVELIKACINKGFNLSKSTTAKDLNAYLESFEDIDRRRQGELIKTYEYLRYGLNPQNIDIVRYFALIKDITGGIIHKNKLKDHTGDR